MSKGFATGKFFITSFWLVLVFFGCKQENTDPPDPPAFVRFLENQTVKSEVLSRDMRYAVLLPADYQSSGKDYPVVYLLHGFGEDETGWYEGGRVQYYIDQNAAVTVPMIYVMPQGFNTYWVNKYNGNYPYMDYFVNELVPAIDSLFRTIPDPQHRAVMGYSMGGYGAMILPAKNPAVFKTGVVLSMSFRTDEQYLVEPQNVFDYQWGPIFGGIGAEGEERLTGYFKQYSPFHFFGTTGSPAFDGLNLFIDCGDDEETLSVTNDAFHDTLRRLGIRHEYRTRNGAHTWFYWHTALPEALHYIGQVVQQIPYPDEPELMKCPSDIHGQIIVEELAETGINYNVILPGSYLSSQLVYPLIVFLHDRTAGSETQESQNLYDYLTFVNGWYEPFEAILVEIPFQENISQDVLQQILDHLIENYKTADDRNQTVLAGNKRAGALAWEFAPGLSGNINACMIFDANLPENAAADNPDIAYYLDITEEGINYKGYHSLYLSLRENDIPHEYRVRQGIPSHNALLNGIFFSQGFLNDHLKN